MIEEFQGEYRWLSNFAPVDIEYQGIAYPSVEHYYQAMKSDKDHIREKIAGFERPAQAKKYGSKLSLPEYWNFLYKLGVMELGLALKFSQEPYKSKLLATDNQYIQEGNYWNDTFWGVDLETDEGDNWLGELIMKTRTKLRK